MYKLSKIFYALVLVFALAMVAEGCDIVNQNPTPIVNSGVHTTLAPVINADDKPEQDKGNSEPLPVIEGMQAKSIVINKEWKEYAAKAATPMVKFSNKVSARINRDNKSPCDEAITAALTEDQSIKIFFDGMMVKCQTGYAEEHQEYRVILTVYASDLKTELLVDDSTTTPVDYVYGREYNLLERRRDGEFKLKNTE